jgi:Thioredoxin-like
MNLFSLAMRGMRTRFAVFGLAAFVLTLSASAQDAMTLPVNEHQLPVTPKINALAHRVLETGLKLNALTGDDLKPWHMKVDFQVIHPGSTKPVGGSVEEWYVSKFVWRRQYQGGTPDMAGSEWSASKIEHYQSKPGHGGFSYAALNLRVTRPVVDPLYQAENIQPDFDLDLKRIQTAGLVLNCVSVADPWRHVDEANPDVLFPTMCFDNVYHLRLTSTSDTSVQFDDLQPFQGRMVARDVKVINKGSLIADMKVSLLEPLNEANADLVKPGKDAVPEPYTIEPGHPQPEAVYEVTASIPLQPNGFPFRGTFLIPILIHKDGSVKAKNDDISFWSQDLKDALVSAINKWKYKPYMVDGQPVEVAMVVPYDVDGKPFVPSYERPKVTSVVTGPDDYSSAYDPRRDPEKDFTIAKAAATQAHKRIFIVVGGNWCIWCKYMDEFFAAHADVREIRDANFVLLKVNMSGLNLNYPFLSKFPQIPAYPYILVVDADGKMLTAQKTEDLEEGAKGYSVPKIKQFLTTWKP